MAGRVFPSVTATFQNSCCTLITNLFSCGVNVRWWPAVGQWVGFWRRGWWKRHLSAHATTAAARKYGGSAVIMPPEVETYSRLTHSSLSPVNDAVGAHQAWGRISCGLTSVLWRHPPLRQIPGHSHRRTRMHTRTHTHTDSGSSSTTFSCLCFELLTSWHFVPLLHYPAVLEDTSKCGTRYSYINYSCHIS